MAETMKVHPVAALFPLLEGAEFEQLKASIAAEGLLQPIEVQDGVIIDGRNRLRACEALGVEPRFEEYTGTAPVQHIIARNVARRHMSPTQLAATAALCAEPYQEEARVRIEATQAKPGEKVGSKATPNLGEPLAPAITRKGETADLLAADFGVSRGSVEKAIAVKKNRPDLMPAMLADARSVSNCYNEMRGKTQLKEAADVGTFSPLEKLILEEITDMSDAEMQQVLDFARALNAKRH